MNTISTTQYAATLNKEDILNHYRTQYQLSAEEMNEFEAMTVSELRKVFIEGESF